MTNAQPGPDAGELLTAALRACDLRELQLLLGTCIDNGEATAAFGEQVGSLTRLWAALAASTAAAINEKRPGLSDADRAFLEGADDIPGSSL